MGTKTPGDKMTKQIAIYTPIAFALAMFAGFYFGHVEHTPSEHAARQCLLRSMQPVVTDSVVFCVEPKTGTAHYYPKAQRHD
jgi:hypothetical protein